MGRTVIIGDVHGCARELSDLLAYVGASAEDTIVFVGDLVVRGPLPHEVVSIARSLHAVAVRGNHEDRLLRWRRARGTGREVQLGAVTRSTAEKLKTRDWEYLESMPLWVDLPSHGVRVVHAGVQPGVPIDAQDPRTLMYVRTLDKDHHPSELRGPRSWAHHYQGPEHVVFGHNANPEPEVALHATGIDTGAVYGGRLTAMVLRAQERVPPPHERLSVLVSIPARRTYHARAPEASRVEWPREPAARSSRDSAPPTSRRRGA